jgi:hypothetical protein
LKYQQVGVEHDDDLEDVGVAKHDLTAADSSKLIIIFCIARIR